jgi:hypothetical protein
VHEDIDDTVIGPPHPRLFVVAGIDEDTLVPEKRVPEKRVPEKSEPEKPEPEKPLSPSIPEMPAAPEPAADVLPELVDPVTPTKQRRVPLTNKRLQESLKTAPTIPGPASVASSLLAVQPPAWAEVQRSAHSFRIGDRAPIALDIPALVGRHPMAPRIPGRELPRLVRVSSPLNEVSGTHLELRQDGASVVVTDLRSTNGTIVRMPGARPLKLRQGESVVVRPGTLVDIGDGNILEILPPPRLAVPADPAPGKSWR